MFKLPRRHKSSRHIGMQRILCRPTLEALEDRTVPSTFVDGFEGPTLNPFWSQTTRSGSVKFPSTALVHSGHQSVEFDSIESSEDKGIGLVHTFETPTYGRVSVWLYDNGAGVFSSNYMILSVGDEQGNNGS